MLQTLEQRRHPGMAGSQEKEESSWQGHSASTDGLSKDIPSTECHPLHLTSIAEQQDTSHHEEERYHVATSTPSLRGLKKGPRSIGGSNREIMHTALKKISNSTTGS